MAKDSVRKDLMKKVVLPMILIAVGGVLWIKFVYLAGSQEPQETVNVFMETARKLSVGVWEEGDESTLKQNLTEWSEGGRFPRSFKQAGIRDITPLFVDRAYGRVVLSTFCLYHFDSFTVGEPQLEDNTATVEVDFTPLEFLGMKQTYSSSSSGKLSLIFYLAKSGPKWCILEVGDPIGKLARSSYRKIKKK